MTLVVSEITRLGVVMVDDSAVTFDEGAGSTVRTGVAKVQYAASANIGFAMWGTACVGSSSMDMWLQEFISTSVDFGDQLEDVASRLADSLNQAIAGSGTVSWNRERRGIHIAGYVDGLPHLYHVHTGGDPNAQHELRVFRDFPFGVPGNLVDFESRLRSVGGYHLRNGFHALFGPLFDAAWTFTSQLPQFGIRWPDGSLENRVSLYRLLSQFIADILVAEGRVTRVAGPFSSLAFDPSGQKIDQLLRPVPGLFPCGSSAEI